LIGRALVGGSEGQREVFGRPVAAGGAIVAPRLRGVTGRRYRFRLYVAIGMVAQTRGLGNARVISRRPERFAG
jgi:ABC-type xylose transport system permease subunit